MFAKQTGQNLHYRKVDVPPTEFLESVARFFREGGKGLNLTVPHKTMGLNVADSLTPRAQRAGAVNVLAVQSDGNVLGDNTDGVGLVRDLRENIGIELGHRRVLICGAGGATRGVLAPLLAQDLRELTIANRDAERAMLLATQFADIGGVRGSSYEDLPAVPFDLIINATSAGLQGETPPLPARAVSPGTVCYDLSYSKHETPFTSWANSVGCTQVHKGWGLLVEQAAESFQIWRGIRPDTQPVLAVLAEQPN